MVQAVNQTIYPFGEKQSGHKNQPLAITFCHLRYFRSLSEQYMYKTGCFRCPGMPPKIQSHSSSPYMQVCITSGNEAMFMRRNGVLQCRLTKSSHSRLGPFDHAQHTWQLTVCQQVVPAQLLLKLYSADHLRLIGELLVENTCTFESEDPRSNLDWTLYQAVL